MRQAVPKGKSLAWALWDWGASAYSAMVTTFVFAVYITSDVFGPGASSKLALTVALTGIVAAVLAPLVGEYADRTGRANTFLRIGTTACAIFTALLFFVQPSPAYLWPGLALMALATLSFQLAEVNYNALLPLASTEANRGRISGLGWGLGYIGGIVILLAAYLVFIEPSTPLYSNQDRGAGERVSMLLTAGWIALFTLPALLFVRDLRREAPAGSPLDGYRRIFATVKDLWRTRRRLAYFMLSAAVYRDGLAGVFTFGAILGAQYFGFEDGAIILFGVAANLVAGVVTFLSGFLDDRVGSKPVIVASLVGMIVAGLCVFGFSFTGQQWAFWTFGLALVVFVGPAQNSSRTYLLRHAPEGKEGEIFGLYATTGRALSFLSPSLYAGAIFLMALLTGGAGQDYQNYGVLGIMAVLATGLALLLWLVRGEDSTLEEA